MTPTKVGQGEGTSSTCKYALLWHVGSVSILADFPARARATESTTPPHRGDWC